MKVQIIYLSSTDDVDSTRDMLGWIQAPRVLLVWPDRGRVLTKRLELVRIQRYAQKRNIQIGLLTFDREVRQNAEELDLPIFDSLDDLPDSRWNMDRPPSIRTTEETITRRITPSPRPSTERTPKWADEIGKRRLRIQGALIICTLLLLGLIAAPEAEIILTPVGENKQESFIITLEIDQSYVNGKLSLPTETVELEISGTAFLSSSGWTSVPAEYARGVVFFTNHTEDPINIPFNTILRTDDPQAISFRTLKSVNLSGGFGARVETLVEALTPGVKGNVAAYAISAIEGPLGLVVSVNNQRPLTGGADDLQSMVTESDLEKLESVLKAELISTAQKRLSSQIGENQAIVEGGIRITDIIDQDINHESGDVGEVIEHLARVNTTALVYHRQELEKMIVNYVSSTLPEGKELVTNSLEYDMQTQVPSLNGDKWGLRIRVDYQAYDSIDSRKLRGMILGRSPESVNPILHEAIPELEKSSVTLSPRWLPVLPLWGARIMFRLDWE